MVPVNKVDRVVSRGINKGDLHIPVSLSLPSKSVYQ